MFDTVDALASGLELLAHAERFDACASDQHAQAARTVRTMGRTLAHLLEHHGTLDLEQLPARELTAGVELGT